LTLGRAAAKIPPLIMLSGRIMPSTNPGAPLKDPRLLIDTYGRRLNYLRLSVTDRCNLRCTYCMPPGGVKKLDHGQVLSLEEIARVAKVAVGLGVEKIRLTGGEPFMRRDLGVLLMALDLLRPRPDLRITTNGILLKENLPLLTRYGVSTVNISLDTLDENRFGAITGMDPETGRKLFRKVWQAIEAALAAENLTVKINVVLLAGSNEDQLEDFAKLTKTLPLAVRFIEYMPVGRHTVYDDSRFISSQEVLQILKGIGDLEQLPNRPGDGPARRFRLAGAKGELGIISAVSSHFCATCNRLRLSAEGGLVPCLLSDAKLDLMPILRSGADDNQLINALLQAAASKPSGHGQAIAHLKTAGCPMSRLGG
jgi:cyclic pyranopterin phosphate synthase